MRQTVNRAVAPLADEWLITEPAALAIARELSTLSPDTRAEMWDHDGSSDATPLYSIDADGIASLEMRGPISKDEDFFMWLFGGASSARLARAYTAMRLDDRVRGVLTISDSPGGVVSGIATAADALSALSAVKPTLTYVDDSCCSAAYWIGSQSRRVSCNSTAAVGSIGCYQVLFDTSAAAIAQGVKVIPVKSAEGKASVIDGAPVTQDAISSVQARVDAIHDEFVASVARGRNMSVRGRHYEGASARPAAVPDDGRVYTGRAAKAVGLVDSIGGLSDARAELLSMIAAEPGSASLAPRFAFAVAEARPLAIADATDFTSHTHKENSMLTNDIAVPAAPVASAPSPAALTQAEMNAMVEALTLRAREEAVASVRAEYETRKAAEAVDASVENAVKSGKITTAQSDDARVLAQKAPAEWARFIANAAVTTPIVAALQPAFVSEKRSIDASDLHDPDTRAYLTNLASRRSVKNGESFSAAWKATMADHGLDEDGKTLSA